MWCSFLFFYFFEAAVRWICSSDIPWSTGVISGFFHIVDENCALMGYYAASSGNFLQKFRDSLPVPSSRVLKMRPIDCSETSVRNYHYPLREPLKMGPIGCPETSVRNYKYSQLNNPEVRSYHVVIFVVYKPVDEGSWLLIPVSCRD